MGWLKNIFTDKSSILGELRKIKNESNAIRHLATALGRTESSDQTREMIISECKSILSADALCLYLIQPKGYFEMIAQAGCTKEFKEQWLRLYPEHVPQLFQAKPVYDLFFGTPQEFKHDFPDAQKLVEDSKRKTIAYAPLVVNQKTIGLLGFSYNCAQCPPDKDFAMTIVSLCAQALERARLFELERLARHEAEKANRAKTDFLTSISHEIRTPISAIKGFADLIAKSDGLHFNLKNWSSRILKNAEHLHGLVGDVLDLSKIEADKIEVYRHVFSLKDFVEDVEAITAFKAEKKGISIRFVSSNSNLDIHSDAILLRQILVNLISNAIKFTTTRGKIEIKIQYVDSKLRIEVKDSGIGIPSQDHSRIFDRFTQVSPTFERGSLGSGLGLTISKRLALALGGSLFLLKSAPDKGSTFVAEIPCTGYKSFQNLARFPSFNSARKLQGLNFLLVDDSLDNQLLVNALLSQEGARVDTADNGVVGVEKALRSDYEVIIMDIQMPELDGNQAVSKLRSTGYKKPIVALTAEVLTHQKKDSMQRGFDEYLLKPIDSEQLINTLGRLAYSTSL